MVNLDFILVIFFTLTFELIKRRLIAKLLLLVREITSLNLMATSEF